MIPSFSGPGTGAEAPLLSSNLGATNGDTVGALGVPSGFNGPVFGSLGFVEFELDFGLVAPGMAVPEASLGVPSAIAWFSTLPAVISASVILYVAV